jgi:hypothetical protein
LYVDTPTLVPGMQGVFSASLYSPEEQDIALEVRYAYPGPPPPRS